MDISTIGEIDSLPVSFAMEIHIQKACLLHLLLALSSAAALKILSETKADQQKQLSGLLNLKKTVRRHLEEIKTHR
ncbi:Hypothetical predicted protein, partial [Paramuricea clavata]